MSASTQQWVATRESCTSSSEMVAIFSAIFRLVRSEDSFSEIERSEHMAKGSFLRLNLGFLLNLVYKNTKKDYMRREIVD